MQAAVGVEPTRLLMAPPNVAADGRLAADDEHKLAIGAEKSTAHALWMVVMHVFNCDMQEGSTGEQVADKARGCAPAINLPATVSAVILTVNSRPTDSGDPWETVRKKYGVPETSPETATL
ncbi:MAG TPA: hypothetical protein VI937_03050 [Negativicutes bacterium]|nr:hypothetical protein [Negativicutes bacterium]